MSDGVLEFIAAETAALTRLVPVPTGELGYGRDLSCVTDITETLEEVDPFSVQGLGEALLRRLITPRGSLPDDADYGIDIRGYCNRALTRQDLLALEGEIRAELAKDDRVAQVQPTVTWASPSLNVKVMVEPAIPGMRPFALTLAAENGAVLLAEVSR